MYTIIKALTSCPSVYYTIYYLSVSQCVTRPWPYIFARDHRKLYAMILPADGDGISMPIVRSAPNTNWNFAVRFGNPTIRPSLKSEINFLAFGHTSSGKPARRECWKHSFNGANEGANRGIEPCTVSARDAPQDWANLEASPRLAHDGPHQP